jgi:hypothetical protein
MVEIVREIIIVTSRMLNVTKMESVHALITPTRRGQSVKTVS